MATTTFSQGYKMKLIGTGLEAGTWGSSTNENLKRIDQSFGGVDIAFVVTAPDLPSSWSSPTLTWCLGDATDAWEDGSEGRNRFVNFTGAPGANTTVNISGNSASEVNTDRVYWVRNSLTGSYTITFSGGSGDDIVLNSGATALIYTSSGVVANILGALQITGLDFTQESTGAAVIKLPTNKASGLLFEDPTTTYDFIKFDTSTSASKLVLGAADTDLEIDSAVIDVDSATIDLSTQATSITLKSSGDALTVKDSGGKSLLTFDETAKVIELGSKADPTDTTAIRLLTPTIDLSNQDTNMKLVGENASGDVDAFDFRDSNSSAQLMLIFDTHNSFVRIPSGIEFKVESGATFEASSGSTAKILNGVTISGGSGTINGQIIGGSAPLAGTFTTGIANTSFSSPLLDATGATGQLKFNSSDIGLKIVSGKLQVKQDSGSFGGLYSAGQASGDTIYFKSTANVGLGTGNLSANDNGSESHSLGSFPRILIGKLKCISIDAGYAVNDEVLATCITTLDTGGGGASANLAICSDVGSVFFSIHDRMYLPNKSTGATTGLDFAKWDVYIEAWK